MESAYARLYDGRADAIDIDAAEGLEDTIARQVVEQLQMNMVRVSEVLESKGFACPWAQVEEIISWFGGSSFHTFPASLSLPVRVGVGGSLGMTSLCSHSHSAPSRGRSRNALAAGHVLQGNEPWRQHKASRKGSTQAEQGPSRPSKS